MGHKRYRDAKIGRESGGFAALPHCVLRSVGITKLSAHASKLLLDLLAQWRGDNNGTLCCAWVVMQGRGWKSRETLDRARRELVESDFLMVTRPGGNHRPTLYALTFYRIDECKGRHDTSPTLTPPSTWFKHEPTHPINTPIVSIAKRPKADGKIKIQHAHRVDRSIINTTGGPINPLSPANDTTGVSVEAISMNESTRPACPILDIPSTQAAAAAPLASPASPPLPPRVLNRQGTPAQDQSGDSLQEVKAEDLDALCEHFAPGTIWAAAVETIGRVPSLNANTARDHIRRFVKERGAETIMQRLRTAPAEPIACLAHLRAKP